MTKELRLVKRGSIYHIHGDGNRVRFSTRTRDPVRAAGILEGMKRERDTGWILSRDEAATEWKAVADHLYRRQRWASKERGIPFELTASDVFWMMKKTGFRCAVSGIRFSKKAEKGGPTDPWSASIDRIENRQGYVRDNVRVVCLAANLAMNQWGLDTLQRLARGIIRSADIVWPEDEFSEGVSHQLIGRNGTPGGHGHDNT